MGLPAIKIDTLAIAKELEEAGLPPKQAEAQTRVYAKVLNMVIEDQLATKQDLQTVERNLQKEIHNVKDDLQERIQRLEVAMAKQTTKLVAWMATFIGLAVTVLGFLIKVLH